jgi:uncharacterized membrane protein YjjP (DUF1212 family)
VLLLSSSKVNELVELVHDKLLDIDVVEKPLKHG